jgi:putative ABC transport system permease protein
VSLLVGIVVTLVATLAPARRATRVPPIAALSEGYGRAERRSRWATPLASILTLAGIVSMAIGLFGSLASSAALSLVGLGAALTFLGVALLSPRFVGPIAGAVGRPMEAARGITGRLARENSVRQPGRTAVTSAALMIGVALVTFASIFASSGKTTVDKAIDTGVRAQAIVQNQAGFGPFSARATDEVSRVPGVSSVTAVRFGRTRVDGKEKSITGIDPRTVTQLFHVDWKQGSNATMRDLKPGEALVSRGYAENGKIKVGETLQLRTPLSTTVPARVKGILDDKSGLTGDIVIPNSIVGSRFGIVKDDFVMVGFAGGRPDPATLKAVKATLDRSYPEAEALTSAEFKKQQGDQINQILALIYALLALAVIVSLFGIVNTLVLSITERTRELGMLRAVGMSRRQVRRVIRYEGVIVAVIGGVIGLVVGIVLSVLVTRAIPDFSLSIPIVQLLLVLILSAVAGVLASILPARRASRLDVLESLAYE